MIFSISRKLSSSAGLFSSLVLILSCSYIDAVLCVPSAPSGSMGVLSSSSGHKCSSVVQHCWDNHSSPKSWSFTKRSRTKALEWWLLHLELQEVKAYGTLLSAQVITLQMKCKRTWHSKIMPYCSSNGSYGTQKYPLISYPQPSSSALPFIIKTC